MMNFYFLLCLISEIIADNVNCSWHHSAHLIISRNSITKREVGMLLSQNHSSQLASILLILRSGRSKNVSGLLVGNYNYVTTSFISLHPFCLNLLDLVLQDVYRKW